jgi:hypothetical protein
VPLLPTPERRDAELSAWYHALVPILDIALRDTGEDDVIGEATALTEALAAEQFEDPARHSFRLATTKLLWIAAAGLETLAKRDLATIAAERGTETRAVLETTMQTSDLREFVKAMTYPDGELPSMRALTEAAILAVRMRFFQEAGRGKRWALAADLLAAVGR